MLKLRVIPVLLWNGVNLIKGVGFNKERKIGSLLPAIRVFNNRLVDELVLFDVAATPAGRGPDLEAVRLASQNLFVPLTVGGGVRSLEDMYDLFKAGADKICLNSSLYENIDLLKKSSRIFGRQSVVVAIDVRRAGNKFFCVKNSGEKVLPLEAHEWVDTVQAAGAGEIILTSIDQDGSFSGYEVELLSQLNDKIKVPLIISGGFGEACHGLKALEASNVSGFGIGSAFFFTEQTPETVRHSLRNAGYPVRTITAPF